MKTQQILDALKLCRGAVEATSIFPIFSHFCFCDSYVYAFNDVSAILAPLESGVTAALRADALIGVLSTLGEEVTIKQEKDSVRLTSGSVKVDLLSLPHEAFLFTPPNPNWEAMLPVTEELMLGLSRCLQTVGDDSQHREFTGVAFQTLRGNLTLYSSDDVRISRFLSGKFPPTTEATTWLLPAKSCALLIAAWQATKEASSGEAPKLYLSQDWAMFEASQLLLYSKMMSETPPDYAGTIKKITPKTPVWSVLHKEILLAVERAAVLVDKDLGAGITFTTVQGALTLCLHQGNGERLGEFEERLLFGPPEKDLSLTLNIVKLGQSLVGMEEMMLDAGCLGVRTGGYSCWVAPFVVG